MYNVDYDLKRYSGKAFVEKHFSAEGKTKALELMTKLAEAFIDRLNSENDWMDAATKAKAAEKMNKMEYLIAYPDNWGTHDVTLDRGKFLQNMLAVYEAGFKEELAEVGKKKDRSKWPWSAATINAGYNPGTNQMNYPAGILQPPFFAATNASPVNYGGIGFVMGHELTHGFDDQGRHYDGDGMVSEWWEEATATAFKERSQCVVDQYSAIEVFPDMFIDGEMTLGENIADLGGVTLALKAYRAARGTAAEQIVDGFTEDQQFFLSAAQVWCAKVREESAKRRLTSDVHSPPKWRVNGPLSNIPDFATAFSCAKGTKMNPDNQCVVW
jgi:putative endopeptidase